MFLTTYFFSAFIDIIMNDIHRNDGVKVSKNRKTQFLVLDKNER